MYSNRTVSWIDLLTALIEYIKFLQNKADPFDFSFLGMVQAIYTYILLPWNNYNIYHCVGCCMGYM